MGRYSRNTSSVKTELYIWVLGKRFKEDIVLPLNSYSKITYFWNLAGKKKITTVLKVTIEIGLSSIFVVSQGCSIFSPEILVKFDKFVLDFDSRSQIFAIHS